MQYIQTVPRLSTYNGYAIADVQIHAIQGQSQKALSSLRQAVDEGWRYMWWYSLRQNLNVESIGEEPEFKSILAELETDMSEKLARVRRWDAAGELAPIPAVLKE